MSLLSLSKKILGSAEDKKKSAVRVRKPAASKKKVKKVSSDKYSILAGKIDLVEITSEQSIQQQEVSTVVFRVRPQATKLQVAQAVQERYGVGVKDVRTANFRPKTRRRGHTTGRTCAWKKAYVTVDDISALNVGP